MADLKQDLQAQFSSIQTYIQSGNILIDKENSTTAEIEHIFKTYLTSKLENEIAVFVYEYPHYKTIIQQHPYQNLEKRNYFCFYKKRIDNLSPLNPQVKDELLDLQEACIHIQYPESYSKSKIDNNFIERKLNCVSTMRNWNTAHKLIQMAEQL